MALDSECEKYSLRSGSELCPVATSAAAPLLVAFYLLDPSRTRHQTSLALSPGSMALEQSSGNPVGFNCKTMLLAKCSTKIHQARKKTGGYLPTSCVEDTFLSVVGSLEAFRNLSTRWRPVLSCSCLAECTDLGLIACSRCFHMDCEVDNFHQDLHLDLA